MFGTSTVLQRIDELKKTVGGLQEALTKTIEQGLAGIRDAVGEVRDAAQRTSGSAASTCNRVETVHTELRGLRDDVDRLRNSADAARAAAESRSDDRILREIAELKATVEGWRADAAEARQAAAPVAPAAASETSASNGEQDGQKHREHLNRAASISSAEITCHRDMWNFLVKHAVNGDLFRLPGKVTEQADGRISVHASGPTLTAALEALWDLQHGQDTPLGVQALARTFYQRIGEALAKAKPTAQPARREETAEATQPGVPLTRIVIDDRPPAETSD